MELLKKYTTLIKNLDDNLSKVERKKKKIGKIEAIVIKIYFECIFCLST